MCQISAQIAYGFKSELIFVYTETDTEKKEAKGLLAAENEDYDSLHALAFASSEVAKWEKEIATNKKTSGRKPQYENYRKMVKINRGDRAKGGIDWFRYRELILRAHLLSNMKGLQKADRDVMIIEDNAGSHVSDPCLKEYHRWGVKRCSDWPPRSPDLNSIEKAWG